MKHYTSIVKKTLCLLLCLFLLAGYLPLSPAAATEDTRIADPSTIHSWKEFFHTDDLNTENAGAVWTDKSVFTDDKAFADNGVKKTHQSSFLAALSAMGSNMSVTGLANVPTDTVMILDLSSSMYNGYDRDPGTVQTMLTSVNQSIQKLQDLNEYNRVGVVIYYGGPDRNQSNAANSMILLPLDRYSGTSAYLKANVTGGRLISVAVNAGVKNSSGAAVPQATRTVTDVAGTYAQLGILDAMEQFLQADTTAPTGATRTPVFLFMSDGEPTAATCDFTQKVTAGMGNNTVSIRNPNETDFVTQLTAAYAKETVDAHYQETTPLFYSLSLGSSVSLSVMDPAHHTTATIDSYWNKLVSNGEVELTVFNSPDAWGDPTVKKTYTVTPTTANGKVFPHSVAQKNYVDKSFTASNAGSLTDAFQDIIEQINLVSKYTPTLVSGNADLSGYISFVDKVGRYMEVSKIHGVLIDNKLFSGKDLARNFVTGGGNLGTYDNPTDLGDEMLHAVQARLGLSSADAARTLISLAYEYGQLSYTNEQKYSNYIGWYANAAGAFLGFWHEDMIMPEATGDPETDPVFTVKSYGYLGAVDESHGVAASDMMYATVQVRENIATGDQTVVFAVPAALLPLLTYEVTLDLEGRMSKLELTGAEHPIRLIYELGLQEHINEENLTALVSPEYLEAHTDSDGNVSFYTNQYEADNSVGYGKVNTYSYFNPSRENDRYYYLTDTPVYSDTKGTLYTGASVPKGSFYRSYVVYTPDGAKVQYRRISDVTLATAKQATDGSWYISAGHVHVNLDGYTVPKSRNETGTLPNVSLPFVDTHDHSVGDLGYRFIIGSTLGNNGRITLTPDTGIAITKVMAEGVVAPTTPFSFTITNLFDAKDNRSYQAWIVDKDLENTPTTVAFSNGTAKVSLYADQTLYIGGMTPGTVYRLTEAQTANYLPEVDSFTVTLTQGKMEHVTFVNAPRGTGNLMISKEVIHDLGSSYTIPENKSFTIHVDLNGPNVKNATFKAIHSTGLISAVTTDENGSFEFTLKHDQQLMVTGLPEGTTVKVTEPNPGIGFITTFQEKGKTGDGSVTIPSGTTDVAVINRYRPAKVEPSNIVLHGTKRYFTEAADWNGAEFEFQLQKWSSKGWTTIATATANEANPSFNFNEAMGKELYNTPGSYHYQVLETNGGQTLEGITYDATLHTFTVIVSDADMDGKLEISRITSAHTGKEFEINQDGNWQIDIAFDNYYHAADCTLVLDIVKRLENLSASPLVSPAGFRFGLYQGDTQIAVSELSDGLGEARLILHYPLEQAGTHIYTLKEIIPDNRIPGMEYDQQAYTLVVQVTDNGDGTMEAAILSINGSTDFDTPVFTNRYRPTSAELSIDFVTKKLTGRELQEGEFTFTVTGTDNQQSLTGTNDQDGKVIFPAPLHFDTVGVFHYTVQETTPSGQGITADDAVYTLRVEVSDQGGRLVADYAVLNLVGTDIVFENTYHAQPATYAIRGSKALKGRMLLNEEFTFCLSQVVNDGGNPIELPIQQTSNFADGSFSFNPVTFLRPGTFTFLVTEADHSSADYGIVYDHTRHLVTLKVEDNLKGQLVVTDVSITADGEPATEVHFTNRYVPNPTEAHIAGSKELIGKVLTGGEFLFELYEADRHWTEGPLLETVKNSKDGSFSFSKMEYDTAGKRYYLIREVNGGQTLDGITYDDTLFRVELDVTDDLRGQLHTQIAIYDEKGIARESILFRNLYVPTGTASVILTGNKTLKGRTLKDGDFTFLLYETGADFLSVGDPIQTIRNDQGKLKFVLSYTPDQIGSTFYYQVTEENAGKTLENIRYSSTRYHITVQVLDDGVGGIQTAVSVTNGTEPVHSLDFVNEYLPDPVHVTLSGEKQLLGKTLTEGAFTFELYEAKADGAPGTKCSTAVNDAKGRFHFPELTFDAPGSWSYLVKEANGGKVVQDVRYDDTVYGVTVTVTKDEAGQLVCETELTAEDAPADALIFINRYVDQPPKTEDPALSLWIILMILTGGAAITLAAKKKKLF